MQTDALIPGDPRQYEVGSSISRMCYVIEEPFIIGQRCDREIPIVRHARERLIECIQGGIVVLLDLLPAERSKDDGQLRPRFAAHFADRGDIPGTALDVRERCIGRL